MNSAENPLSKLIIDSQLFADCIFPVPHVSQPYVLIAPSRHTIRPNHPNSARDLRSAMSVYSMWNYFIDFNCLDSYAYGRGIVPDSIVSSDNGDIQSHPTELCIPSRDVCVMRNVYTDRPRLSVFVALSRGTLAMDPPFGSQQRAFFH